MERIWRQILALLINNYSMSPRWITLRAESPSIFLDKSGRGRRLCERLQDSLIRRSSEKTDESVQFPVGQTGFSSTRMIIPKNC